MVKKLINQNTLAIVVTNYAGINTKIEELSELAKKNNIFLIEDNAQGIFSQLKGKYLGTYGDLSVLSFHETKSISSGEGGAVIINNPIFLDRAIKLRDKGTNRREFDHNLVNKYDWYENGSNYYMSEIHALFLYFQLKGYIKKINKRRKFWLSYYNAISKLELSDKILLPDPNLFKNSNYHIFYLIFNEESNQKEFIRSMKTLNISTPFHYTDLSKSPGGQIFQSVVLPVTESVTQTLVRLPLFANLSRHDHRRILKGIKKFLAK
jgi:dTDP-4-amino-4,6-dideoxygalactose transaminase